MTRRPRALGSWFAHGDSRIAALASESAARSALRERIRRCLPAAFAPQCSHAELEAGTLIVFMQSAAGATLLRYQLGELQTRLAAGGFTCSQIRVQVLPSVPQAAAAAPAVRVFEESVRQRLETTAASLEDGVLRRSIRNLARHRREPR